MIKTSLNQIKINTDMKKTADIEDKSKGKENIGNEAKILPVCYRCARVPRNGLYDGFRVEGMFFCSGCQEELLKAEQGSPEYQEFLFLFREILF
jgi:Inhibitor of sigma-G Gin.